MAVKSTGKVTEQAEQVQAVENTTEAEKAENGANNEATAAQEVLTLAYIGPTLPAGQLKSNKIMTGTLTDIKKELAAVLEKYPLVEKMMVPIAELSAKKDKVRTAGNIMNKYYSDIVSTIAANEAKEV